MEREVGGGIRMGNTCKPMAVSFQCMTKFIPKKKKEALLGAWSLIDAQAYRLDQCSSNAGVPCSEVPGT